jgi:hypothetical protein
MQYNKAVEFKNIYFSIRLSILFRDLLNIIIPFFVPFLFSFFCSSGNWFSALHFSLQQPAYFCAHASH